MELFYCEPSGISGNIITLDDFESKHLTKTLRKKVGDPADITDGIGHHYTGTIISLKPKVTIQVESEKKASGDLQKISLGIGFIRPNRLEFVLEKCTELGVNIYYLFKSEYSNYFSDNNKRFEKILRQAIKQSNRFYLPELHLCPSFKEFLELTHQIPIKIAAIAPESPALKKVFEHNEPNDTLIAIGPEGGFSENEIVLMKDNDFHDVSLGRNRLRAETAAMAAVSYLQINT